MNRLIFLLVGVGLIVAPSAAQGPTSEYYIADGGSGQLSVVQGTSIIRSWTMRNTDQMPIAVAGTVRTFGEYPSSFGSEYDYYGNWTGVDYADQGGPQNQRVDGGTDGVRHNFLAGWNDGGIWQYDLDWKNPVRLFSADGPTGVTYDTVTGHLWVIEHTRQTVTEFAMDGTRLSAFGFSTPSGWMGALAYEPATDTLWATNFSTDDIYQYAKDGTLLQNVLIPGLAGYAWGGEFIIPEPSALALLSVGLLTLLRRR